MKHLYAILLLSLCFTFFLKSQSTLSFDFQDGPQGWAGDFADYFVGEEEFFELTFEWSALPLPLDTSQKTLFIQGHNRSDDLFMFIKYKMEGLQANALYELDFLIELASEAPTNAVGIGGPPGEAVVLKAGASAIEPLKVDNGQDFYEMNIDKGIQSNPGKYMDTIGHIGVADETFDFALIQRSNSNRPFLAQSDENGVLWLIIGTDSGFEGRTRLYYNKIEVQINFVTSSVNTFRPNTKLFPNPSQHFFTLQHPLPIQDLSIYNLQG